MVKLPNMSLFKNPSWVDSRLLKCKSLDEIPTEIFRKINARLANHDSTPLASVVIPAWNEEVNIVRTLDSLSKSRTSFPFEIIVVNNNSTDRTQEALDKLPTVKSIFQPVKGCGPARQIGQENAQGKYSKNGESPRKEKCRARVWPLFFSWNA
jgi:hypothetical protein